MQAKYRHVSHNPPGEKECSVEEVFDQKERIVLENSTGLSQNSSYGTALLCAQVQVLSPYIQRTTESLPNSIMYASQTMLNDAHNEYETIHLNQEETRLKFVQRKEGRIIFDRLPPNY